MSDCVYVIQADNGEVKLGLSGTPFARLSKVRKEYGPRRQFGDAYLVGFVTTRFGLFVESSAHSELKRFAVGGEWYRVSSLLALGVVAQIAGLLESNIIVQTFGPAAEAKVTVKTFREFVQRSIPNFRS
jgi:hypothetical protein